jgi:hypothetical protein
MLAGRKKARLSELFVAQLGMAAVAGHSFRLLELPDNVDWLLVGFRDGRRRGLYTQLKARSTHTQFTPVHPMLLR